MELSDDQQDRAAGALLGLAAGDALGAPYEFTTPGRGADIVMRAGGVWELGEWTDDTAQAVGIAEVAATGSLDMVAIGQRFLDWFHDAPKDVGISTRAVLGDTRRVAADLPAAAATYFEANPRGAAGNGSLMRTAPVALACLGDDRALVHHATAVSLLTHGDPLAAEGCVLWCVAIDRPPTRSSTRRRSPPTTRPDTCAMPSSRPSASATTPTPWRPSPGRCWVHAGGPGPYRPSGAPTSTGGRAWTPTTSSGSPSTRPATPRPWTPARRDAPPPTPHCRSTAEAGGASRTRLAGTVAVSPCGRPVRRVACGRAGECGARGTPLIGASPVPIEVAMTDHDVPATAAQASGQRGDAVSAHEMWRRQFPPVGYWLGDR